MDNRVAAHIISTLDRTANTIQGLKDAGKLKPEVATELIGNLDSFADKFESASFGEEAFKARQAKVIQSEPDEPYMDTFENPQKVIKGEPDEKYMHHTGPTFQGKGMGTYDTDDTSQVSDRDEYAVRELSEWSDKTSKQPTWTKGPAGKSTAWG